MRRLPGTKPIAAYFLSLVLLVGAACATRDDTVRGGRADTARRVYVVQSGWHGGLILSTRDISPAALPEIRHFAAADYIEFGWGDQDYYQAPDPGLGLALRAAFWSRGSVLHVYSVRGSLEAEYAGRELLEVALDDPGFQRLIAFVSGTFSRPLSGEAAEGWSAPNIPGRFYKAAGAFHLFRNCNTWIAEALRSAGVPVAGPVITSGSLMDAVRPYAYSR